MGIILSTFSANLTGQSIVTKEEDFSDYQALSFNGCELRKTLTTKWTHGPKKGEIDVSTWDVSLSTVDPSKVKDSYDIIAGTYENKKVVKWACNCPTSVGTTTTVYDMFVIEQILPPEENRSRVVKAFKHLVRLCGGKEELF